MQAIIDFFKNIAGFFKSVIDFVVNLFNDLIYVIQVIGQAIAKIPTYLAFIPQSIVALFVLALTVIVVYKIAGRD